MAYEIKDLISDIQCEEEKLCEYEDEAYQHALELVNKTNMSQEDKEMCKNILTDETGLYEAYLIVEQYLTNKGTTK